MRDLVLEIAQELQFSYARDMLSTRRKWHELSLNAQTVWLALAQRVILRTAGALQRAALAPSLMEEPSIGKEAAEPPLPAAGVNAAVLSKFFGVSRRSLCRYVREGMPHWRTPGGHLRFDIKAATAWKETPPARPATEQPGQLTGREIARAQERGREIARAVAAKEKARALARSQKP